MVVMVDKRFFYQTKPSHQEKKGNKLAFSKHVKIIIDNLDSNIKKSNPNFPHALDSFNTS